jgi:hypothetical protein
MILYLGPHHENQNWCEIESPDRAPILSDPPSWMDLALVDEKMARVVVAPS